MSLKKFIFRIVMMVSICILPIHAEEIPDLTKTGSIHITMHYDGEKVGGGSFVLYSVGTIVEKDGSYQYQLKEEFMNGSFGNDQIYSAELASQLSESNVLSNGIEQLVDENGEVSFLNVNPGLYLVVQKNAAEGFNKANPFLIGLPTQRDGVYVYEVDASPKVELEKDTENIRRRPPTPDTPDGRRRRPMVPDTGLLQWPIPILTITGLIFMILGFAWKGKETQTV